MSQVDYIAPKEDHLMPRQLEEEDVNHFKSIVGESGVLTTDIEGYNTDWLGKYKGQSQLVLRPKNTQQISDILKHCNQRKLAVVPQAGNTGLVGGSVPVFDEIVLSTNLMNQIKSFDDVSGTLVCQSGCILEQLNEKVMEHGYIMPLDLAAKGSCQIGGNLATSAGGIRYLRYKSLHANVLGMEFVLPDGTIVDTLKSIRKDNTGYHLPHLMIGSEGTLGIITAVSMSVPSKPKSVNVVYLAVDSFEKIQLIYRAAKLHLGEILSAFEFFDAKCRDLVVKHGANDPLDQPYSFYLVIETHGSEGSHDQDKLSKFFEHVLEEQHATDGTMSTDETQAKALWRMRESISECLRREGGTRLYKYDVSMPLPIMYKLVSDTKERLGSEAQVFGFGHLGDDNLHLNIIIPENQLEMVDLIEPFVYEWTQQHNGSISAEHGVGMMKRDYLKFSQTEQSIQMMRLIKKAIDPNNIMNPYKMFTV
ncbi:D-2-hydroxyglutarate dehydrogenase, mitochondrial [Acrasis kona]|uniref:D-2-hydroxyglutarate dehydrogenase, mitochondrial n=1 Tax=Acrasis kona TaxID=1008807 RepID=A0AAW2YSV8_9EUKA